MKAPRLNFKLSPFKFLSNSSYCRLVAIDHGPRACIDHGPRAWGLSPQVRVRLGVTIVAEQSALTQQRSRVPSHEWLALHSDLSPGHQAATAAARLSEAGRRRRTQAVRLTRSLSFLRRLAREGHVSRSPGPPAAQPGQMPTRANVNASGRLSKTCDIFFFRVINIDNLM